jgi:hypothetical protein
MGWFSSACSAVSSFVSSTCSAIGSACSAIGGALFAGASGIGALATGIVGSIVALTLPEILIAIQVIGAIVSVIAEALGLKNKEETPEELGMKAEEAEKKPEEFESTEAYIEYLRKEVEVDKEKLNNLKDEDKIKYAAIGSSLYIKAIEEKYDMKMPVEFWTTVADLKMDGNQVKEYIDSFKKHNIEDMGDMTGYIKNDLQDGKDKGKISDAMIDALKEINPELSENDLYDKLNNLKAE